MTDLAKARRKAREWTLQFLFSIDVKNSSLDELKNIALDRFWNMMEASEEAEEIRKYPKSKNDAIKKINGIFANAAVIDEKIVKAANNWTLDRMAVVDRNIIRLGAYEILFCDEIPPKVSINEAVEMAKEFADKDSTKFINGVLDRIKREAE
jgi:N utilization substance protein B